MNYAVHKISLDIHKPESQVVLNVKQIDTGRKIKISLTEDGRPYVLSSDCLAIFKAKTPDGKDIKMDCAIDGNVIIYTISFQTTATLGEVECEIMLYNESGMLITSPRFVIIVNDRVHSEGSIVESDSEASSKFVELVENKLRLIVKEELTKPSISERPTATIELTAEQGFIVPGIDVGLIEGSFAICDLYGALDENILPVGTEIAKIELRREDDDPETGWIDINEMYKRDGSFMHIVYSEVFLLNGCRIIAVAISQNCGESFIIEELNVFNNPIARVTYYTD